MLNLRRIHTFFSQLSAINNMRQNFINMKSISTIRSVFLDPNNNPQPVFEISKMKTKDGLNLFPKAKSANIFKKTTATNNTNDSQATKTNKQTPLTYKRSGTE